MWRSFPNQPLYAPQPSRCSILILPVKPLLDFLSELRLGDGEDMVPSLDLDDGPVLSHAIKRPRTSKVMTW